MQTYTGITKKHTLASKRVQVFQYPRQLYYRSCGLIHVFIYFFAHVFLMFIYLFNRLSMYVVTPNVILGSSWASKSVGKSSVCVFFFIGKYTRTSINEGGIDSLSFCSTKRLVFLLLEYHTKKCFIPSVSAVIYFVVVFVNLTLA